MNTPVMAPALVVDAYIETVESAASFAVLSGWLILNGSVEDLTVTVSSGRYSTEIRGFFGRDDIEVLDGQRAFGFCADIHFPAKISRNTVFTISCAEAVFEFSARELGVQKFMPRGAFDVCTVEYIAGWVYDPALWYERALIAPTIVVGELVIPVSVDCRRHELPFSAARVGKELGFQLSITTYAAEIVKLCPEGSGKVTWCLMSADQKIAELETSITQSEFDRLKTLARATTKGLEIETSSNQIEVAQARPVEPTTALDVEKGYLDYWGYSPGLEGWVIGGWARNGAFTSSGECVVEGIFNGSKQSQEAIFITYNRPDVADVGVGFVLFMSGAKASSDIASIVVTDAGERFALRRSDSARAVDEGALLHEARTCGRKAINERRPDFLKVVERPVFDGSDTISAVGPSVQVGIDEVIFASGCGVVLIGWLLDPTSQIQEVRLRNAHGSCVLTNSWVRSDRADIKQAFGSALGLTHAKWGFTTFGRLAAEQFAGFYLEIILKDGRIGHRALGAPTREGIPAINRILHDVVLGPDTILDVCKDVIAEPVRAINRNRLKGEVVFQEAAAGSCTSSPRASIVIPLYGRLDFLTYQAALFDRQEHMADEFIYVLDQPERKEEFFELARIAHIKTGVPFRLLVPSQNLGFAGASNLGLKVARGKYVCFLNSDVMPGTSDWMSQLVAALETKPDVGIVSALMLFEDETVQHSGMDFERQQQYGNMLFPFHPGKGRFRAKDKGFETVPAVTGACMLMDRNLCNQFGGFDEDYIVGDFEDADLCMKVRAEGLSCAVENRVVLYHLERQSQTKAANRSRMNLTLLNAWTFTERWDPELLVENKAAVLKIA